MSLKLKPERCAVLLALALGACASQTAELQTAATPTAVVVPAGAPPAATPPGAAPPAQTISRLPTPTGPSTAYKLTSVELELDCKKLTGRMAVRIVQLRDYKSRTQTTAVSRAIQSTTTSLLGGTMEGTDPDGRYARDLSQLEAYNQRLAEKDCPNFDLPTSLDPNMTDPPRTRRVKKS